MLFPPRYTNAFECAPFFALWPISSTIFAVILIFSFEIDDLIDFPSSLDLLLRYLELDRLSCDRLREEGLEK